MLSRALWGAMGVNAIALLYIPGLSAPFRLLKWGIWGVVLATLAVFTARSDTFPSLRLIPPDRRIFMAAYGLVLCSVFFPIFSTPYITAHAAGSLQMGMGFSFSFLVALHLINAEKTARWQSLFVLGVGGAILSILVLFQASGFSLPGFAPAQSAEFMAFGTLGNPNWTAAFLLPLVPVLLGVRAHLSDSEDGKTRIIRPTCTAMAILIAAATLFTRSKAGAIALVLGILAYVLLNPRLKRQTLISAIIGLFALAFALLAFLVSSGMLQTLTFTRGRLFLWEACLMLIAKRPFSGAGLGGFLPACHEALPLVLKGDPLAYMPLHRIEFAYHDVLQLAVDAGIFSAFFFLLLVFYLLHHAFRDKDHLSRGVGASVAAMTVYGCFDSPLQLPGTLALWWFLVGWMMSGKTDDRNMPITAMTNRRLSRIVFVSFIALLGIVQAVRFFAADLFWTQGMSKLRVHHDQEAAHAFDTATRFTPENAKLLSESAKAFLLARNLEKALETVNHALLAGFCFDDLFLKQRIIKKLKGPYATVDEWQRMARDFPGLFIPHMELARIYLKQNNPMAARIELETVLRIRQNGDHDRPYKTEAKRLLKKIDPQF